MRGFARHRHLKGFVAKRQHLQFTRRQFVAAAGLALVGTAYRGSEAPEQAAAAATSEGGKTLVIGWGSPPNGFDENFNASLRSVDIYRNCSLAPFMHAPQAVGDVFQSDFSKLVPQAAKEWKIDQDWRHITITLKEGIRSPEGNELTADDALYQFKRYEALGGHSWPFTKDALRITTTAAIKKLGKYTYGITSDAPNVLLQLFNAHCTAQILDSVEYKKHATADDPWATKWAASHWAGHGPWVLTEYNPGQSWTLERNKNYFDPAGFTGNVTKVINRAIPESATRVALLQTGSIDIAFDLEAAELKKMEHDTGVRVDHLVGNHLQWLGFSFNSPETRQLNDRNVRLAIAYALPFDQLVDRPYLGLAQQMRCTVAPAYKGYDVVSHIWNGRKQDLAKAKAYLAKSTAPTGFKTTLHFNIAEPGQEESAIIIKSALAQLGIDAEIRKVQSGDYFNLAFEKQGFPGLFIYQDMAGTPDVNFGTHLWLKTGHCCAPGKYSNPEVDKLYSQAQGSVGNFNKRVELQRQIDDIVINEDPMGVPLQALGFHGASRRNVGGWWWQSLNEILLEKAWKN